MARGTTSVCGTCTAWKAGRWRGGARGPALALHGRLWQPSRGAGLQCVCSGGKKDKRHTTNALLVLADKQPGPIRTACRNWRPVMHKKRGATQSNKQRLTNNSKHPMQGTAAPHHNPVSFQHHHTMPCHIPLLAPVLMRNCTANVPLPHAPMCSHEFPLHCHAMAYSATNNESHLQVHAVTPTQTITSRHFEHTHTHAHTCRAHPLGQGTAVCMMGRTAPSPLQWRAPDEA